jgi:lipid-binding SYLF domain-containing protein
MLVGSDASAAWGNGKSAHEDPNAQVVFYGQSKGVSASFGLDGATLKRDQSGDKAPYGKDLTYSEIVESGAGTPAIAQPFVDKLAQTIREGSARCVTLAIRGRSAGCTN